MDNSYVTIALCNFNTTEITSNAIRSIIRRIKTFKYKIIVLDNSDKIPYIIPKDLMGKIKVLDNTNNHYLNFSKYIDEIKLIYRLIGNNANNYGSLKHCMSIQFLINICQTRGLLLFDSDIIVKQDLDKLIDYNFATVADIQKTGDILDNGKIYTSKTRFLPYIQFFNLDYPIEYFNILKCHGIFAPNNGNYYDTGASYFEFVTKNQFSYKQISHLEYINHLHHGSWLNTAENILIK